MQLIRGKPIWIERSGRRDVYRRTLAALRIGGPNGVNAGMELVREELVLPYKRGAAAKEDRLGGVGHNRQRPHNSLAIRKPLRLLRSS